MFAMSSLYTIGRNLPNIVLRAFFMLSCKPIVGAQPRIYVVMAYVAYGYRLDNGKWAPIFNACTSKNNQIMKKSNETQVMSLQVTDGVSVDYIPSQEHEYLMTTEQVAKGYGIGTATLRRHRMEHADELVEGKHFIVRVSNLNADRKSATYKQILWTKRGIVRLGFFVKSERAKIFRNLTEDLVIKLDEHYGILSNPSRRLINRLDRDRLIRLLTLTNHIENTELRISITNELTGGLNYGNI